MNWKEKSVFLFLFVALTSAFFAPVNFAPDGVLSNIHTCPTADYSPFGYPGGESASPAMKWGQPPGNAMSAVMVLDDPDAEVGLGYTYLHWAVTDLPVVGSLPFNASALGNIDGDEVYPYVALCPPSYETQLYRFQLYFRAVEKTTLNNITDHAEGVVIQLQRDPDTISVETFTGIFPAFGQYSP
eukprot:CAMPEP_0201478428 /NCGR_PEP_ID=MMETSP0151_2-20130828/3266_1 /ASSEMBLY_ACC=CAM_ASM_000257 /TAXON_ID=200890 /ORGANISM="Paramoeba atlantica, Strain 621/1 / CCAP 1560/9" /LENGTH=184 /DNA_ID=CAMNT_0047859493 /DNA_START=68 /DNA_END=622 /DNA_ORIENTATION=-